MIKGQLRLVIREHRDRISDAQVQTDPLAIKPVGLNAMTLQKLVDECQLRGLGILRPNGKRMNREEMVRSITVHVGRRAAMMEAENPEMNASRNQGPSVSFPTRAPRAPRSTFTGARAKPTAKPQAQAASSASPPGWRGIGRGAFELARGRNDRYSRRELHRSLSWLE